MMSDQVTPLNKVATPPKNPMTPRMIQPVRSGRQKQHLDNILTICFLKRHIHIKFANIYCTRKTQATDDLQFRKKYNQYYFLPVD